MKFVHIADMHFDSTFTVLNTRSNLGEKRRLEQREVFKRVIEYIKVNKIEYFFISGDLYEHQHVRETTIQYINSLFCEIPDTKIYISPGNHDPYMKGSMYEKFDWSENVKIFSNNVEVVENEEVDIYGFGFNDFYCKHLDTQNIQIQNKNKINILIIHGTLDGGAISNFEYNPLSRNQLKTLGFDYIALGHIHKPDYCSEVGQRIVYPGSTISLGFDELGKHGFILGDISKENIHLEFLPIDQREFKEQMIDVTEIFSVEELIEKIDTIHVDDDAFYKIVLIGKRNFEVDIYYLYQFKSRPNIIKIKDETSIGIDIDKMSDEISLRGIFLGEILKDIREERIEKDMADKIIEIGLDVLK